LLALKDVWAVAALFFFVMGGIYVGFFTATEGAAMGAFGAMVFALWRRALTWKTSTRLSSRARAPPPCSS
jgi:TRAP-type mannitol/chloroaromatic compound transport system permease large subunit